MATPYEIELERQKREISDSEEHVRQAEEFYKFFVAHRNIKPIDANRSLLRNYFGDKPQDISVATLEIAISNPDLNRQLSKYKSEEDLRDQLTEKIRGLLTGSPQSIEHTISQLRYQETGQMQAKLDELERRQVARAKSPEELRAELHETTTGVPPLPAEYTKAVIFKMAPAALRKLTQVYALSAVNARIQRRG